MNEKLLKKAYEMAIKDLGRYYFVAFSIRKDPSVYSEIFASPNEDAYLLLRKSGTVQVLSEGECVTQKTGRWITETLSNINWKTVICLRMHLEFIHCIETDFKLRKGGYISRCTPEEWKPTLSKVETEKLSSEHIDSVVALYEKVFTGYAPKSYMHRKLENNDGRGYLILDNDKCLAVAQSDFELENAALIVGVASDPEVRGQGFGKACMIDLGNTLVEARKSMYLIYDNPIAGNLYKSLGFIDYDRLYHVEKE